MTFEDALLRVYTDIMNSKCVDLSYFEKELNRTDFKKIIKSTEDIRQIKGFIDLYKFMERKSGDIEINDRVQPQKKIEYSEFTVESKFVGREPKERKD